VSEFDPQGGGEEELLGSVPEPKKAKATVERAVARAAGVVRLRSPHGFVVGVKGEARAATLRKRGYTDADSKPKKKG
jgi:hypothetical protein